MQGEVCSMLTIYTQRGSSGLLGDDAENDYYDLTALAEAVGKELLPQGRICSWRWTTRTTLTPSRTAWSSPKCRPKKSRLWIIAKN